MTRGTWSRIARCVTLADALLWGRLCVDTHMPPQPHLQVEAAGGPSAKVAEHSSPFIDLRSPSPERNDPPKREDEVPRREGPTPIPGIHVRNARYTSGWRINERYVPSREKRSWAWTVKEEYATRPSHSSKEPERPKTERPSPGGWVDMDYSDCAPPTDWDSTFRPPPPATTPEEETRPQTARKTPPGKPPARKAPPPSPPKERTTSPMQTDDEPARAPATSPPPEAERAKKARRTSPILVEGEEDVSRRGFASAELEVVEVRRPLPHRVWSVDYPLSCTDNGEITFSPLSVSPYFSSRGDTMYPLELKCLVTSKYEYSRVLGVGKLLRTDGRRQYFLFVLRKGERAKAWWEHQRLQGRLSAYAQTWSPTGGHKRSTWDRVETAQMAEEGITLIRPDQRERWREATRLLREQERQRADSRSRGRSRRRTPSPPPKRTGKRWSPNPSESEEGECDSPEYTSSEYESSYESEWPSEDHPDTE